MDLSKRSLGVQEPESYRSQATSPNLITRVTASAFGRCMFEREFGDQDRVSVGQASAATIVVPGEIGAHSLLEGGQLHTGPFAGELVGASGSRSVEAFAGPIVLQPGDEATLQLVDHPHVQVVLRREPSFAVNLRAPIGARDLFPVLTYGLTAAMLLAALATSMVLVSEVHEVDDASNDIARAMYNLDPRIEPTFIHEVAVPEQPAQPEPESFAVAGTIGGEEVEDGIVGGLTEVESQLPPKPQKLAEVVVGVEVETETEERDEPKALVEGPRWIPDDPGFGAVEAYDLSPSVVAVGDAKKAVLMDEVARVDDLVNLEVVDVADSGPPLLAIVGTTREDPQLLVKPDVALPSDLPTNELQAGIDVTQVVGMDRLPSPGTSQTKKTAVTCDDPNEEPKSQVDVVFVIDVSTTMKFMFDELEQGISEFDAQVRAQTTGDLHYGLVVFVDDVLVTGLGQPYTDVAEIRKELAHWRRFTASNRQINSSDKNTDWPENSLDALYAAARDFSWRPHADTLRLIVHASDDDFREAPAIQSNIAVQHTYAEVVGRLQSERIRVASFAAQVGGECECLDVKPGWFGPYKGQPSIPEATAGVVFDIGSVARGELKLAEAVSATVMSKLCSRYPFLELLE